MKTNTSNNYIFHYMDALRNLIENKDPLSEKTCSELENLMEAFSFYIEQIT